MSADSLAREISSGTATPELSDIAQQSLLQQTGRTAQGATQAPAMAPVSDSGDVVEFHAGHGARDAFVIGHGLMHADQFERANSAQGQMNAQAQAVLMNAAVLHVPASADLAVQQLVMQMMQSGVEAKRAQDRKFADDRGKQAAAGIAADAKDGLMPGQEIETNSAAAAE